MINKFISYLKENEWYIVDNEKKGDALKNDVIRKFNDLSPNFIKLIESYQSISSKDDTVGFLCLVNYCENTEYSFRWNEFELMSLEAAFGDEQWEREVKEWWKDKLPFVISVKNGYEYYAIDMGNNGNIINGSEPEFEEAVVVANSFEDFLQKVMDGIIVL